MQNDLLALKDKLASSEDIVILIVPNPTLDVMAASLGLYLSLEGTGKSPKLICESDTIVRDSRLVGVDKVTKPIGSGNLTLTVNIEGDIVDKVTSAVEGGKLSLTIIPKSGTTNITPQDILFTNSGVQSELIIAVGASNLSDFGALSPSSSTLVNLSNLTGNFGTINLVDPSSSLCELVTAVIQELKLPLTQDIASNLMQGIETATDNLQSASMTADTFEALAVLYRAGARHQSVVTTQQATIIDNTPIVAERQKEDQEDIKALESELHQMTKPSPDWLKPKIFSSGSDK